MSSWSNVKAVPDWFGADDQGGGVAAADISGNGRPDLIVLHLDNPGGENHGYYRVGWNCGIGSWGGRCLSLGDYVTGTGPTRGAGGAGGC